MTLTTFKKEMLELLQHQVQPKTLKSYEFSLTKLTQHLGDIDITTITALNIEQFKSKAINGGLKPGSVNICLRSSRAIFNRAIELGYVTANPFIKKKLTLKISKKAPAFLNEKEFTQVMAKVPTPALVRLYTFLFFTGCRLNEAYSLKIENVDLDKGLVSIVCDEDFTTKSGNGRGVPLSNAAAEALRVQIGGRKTGKVWDYSYYYITQKFKKCATAAGLGHVHLHSLRHSLASNLLMKGAEITSVSNILGHASITTTFTFYSHLTGAHLKNTIALMN